ncbi:MAG TPA: 4Fe-4S ferredoxin, partial [Candidatus Limnocylindria bacterium]|nr:4Fe-4S ferredoxin [Candidatus Limnocylindria bacterium]
TMCIDRVEHQELPACVKACPADALEFGDRAAVVRTAEARVASLKGRGLARARTYGVEELGGLAYVYVLQDEPSAYQLPDVPTARAARIGDQLRDWGAGAAAFALGSLPVWWVFRRRQELAAARAREEER